MVWYSHLFKNFPQFVEIQIVKGFSVVNEADVFLKVLCFLYDPMNVGYLISASSASLKPSLCIWKFSVHILLKLSLNDLSIIFLVCEMNTIVLYFEHSLTLPFFGTGIGADLFQSCGHYLVF